MRTVLTTSILALISLMIGCGERKTTTPKTPPAPQVVKSALQMKCETLRGVEREDCLQAQHDERAKAKAKSRKVSRKAEPPSLTQARKRREKAERRAAEWERKKQDALFHSGFRGCAAGIPAPNINPNAVQWIAANLTEVHSTVSIHNNTTSFFEISQIEGGIGRVVVDRLCPGARLALIQAMGSSGEKTIAYKAVELDVPPGQARTFLSNPIRLSYCTSSPSCQVEYAQNWELKFP